MKTLFSNAELLEELGRVAMRGFTLRYRVVPKSKAGGTWIAQVSRDGKYINAQHVSPTVAVARLAWRIVEADRCTGNARWRQWRRRPWKEDR